MRVLIIDDDQKKIDLVAKFLQSSGVPHDDILTAEHAAQARILLDQNYVDVVLIDVLIPARNGAIPKGENSVDLIRQIVEDGTTPAPRYILGMTSSLDARKNFNDEYQSLVTLVMHVAPDQSEWCDTLKSLLSLIGRADASLHSNNYDVCVLNALRSPELEAVYESWPLILGAEYLIRRNIVCRTGILKLGSKDLRIVCAHLSQMGPIASAHAATALLTEFRPRVLLMTGICGGFSQQVQLGDVIVAEKSWDWQAGKWTDDGTLANASDQRDAASELVASARSVESKLSYFHESYVGSKPPSPARLIVGPMVTGSSVIASLDIQKAFRDQHRKMVGVDMECYGLYYAAENHPGIQTLTICIKAVSDLADRAKNDNFQMYCSHMSAIVSLEMLKHFFR